MIKNYLITGDTHRDFSRFSNLYFKYNPEETAIIILGDSGINIYFDGSDDIIKNILMEMGFTFYILRGNHDERPEKLKNIQEIDDACGRVLIQPAWPRLKYLIDGETYNFNGCSCLALGGAYSVDKSYRLSRGLPWFPLEQLTASEMKDIEEKVTGKKFDLILSHTCPTGFQPTDKFLSFINQDLVDNTMEHWMEDLKTKIKFNLWCFGHYHLERYNKEKKYRIFYKEIINLDEVEIV